MDLKSTLYQKLSEQDKQNIKENQSIKKIFLKMDNKEMTLKYFQYNK